ncbi:type II secretion system F family protein [Longivirga aurantiaca]|uniref:Type II secretion system F family protein n=1 Tax=Longivirga aurantiaca TaxID=1837743 RepID=A0ABW1T599_9ACTN
MVTAALVAAALVLVLLPGRPPARHRRRSWAPSVPRPARAAERRRAELEWVEALAAETRAGRDPASAVVAAGSESMPSPAIARAVAAAGGGGDVAAALRSPDGASDLMRAVAACWEVAHGSGAGLSASLAALADAGRESERVRRDLRAGLAEPRATAVVLAALPVVGLGLGAGLGADPFAWLLRTGPGLAVLAAGVALELVGVLWSWRIVTALEADL